LICTKKGVIERLRLIRNPAKSGLAGKGRYKTGFDRNQCGRLAG
jgi:hypothetical protein